LTSASILFWPSLKGALVVSVYPETRPAPARFRSCGTVDLFHSEYETFSVVAFFRLAYYRFSFILSGFILFQQKLDFYILNSYI